VKNNKSIPDLSTGSFISAVILANKNSKLIFSLGSPFNLIDPTTNTGPNPNSIYSPNSLQDN